MAAWAPYENRRLLRSKAARLRRRSVPTAAKKRTIEGHKRLPTYIMGRWPIDMVTRITSPGKVLALLAQKLERSFWTGTQPLISKDSWVLALRCLGTASSTSADVGLAVPQHFGAA